MRTSTAIEQRANRFADDVLFFARLYPGDKRYDGFRAEILKKYDVIGGYGPADVARELMKTQPNSFGRHSPVRTITLFVAKCPVCGQEDNPQSRGHGLPGYYSHEEAESEAMRDGWITGNGNAVYCTDVRGRNAYRRADRL